MNVGFSIDQSRTGIDVPLAIQSANLDLTQLGFNASVDKGPWTWAMALVHGFGNINSSRDTGFGYCDRRLPRADRRRADRAQLLLDGDQSRFVPKAALEYVRASTGSFQEMGGLDPVAVSGATLERARILLGAEIGHYWIVDQNILDISAYGKFVDNFEQNLSQVAVTRAREHHGAGDRRKQVRRGCRSRAFTEPEQHRACLPQL